MSQPKGVGQGPAPELTRADEACREHAGRKGDLLIVLQKIQAEYGYVPPESLPTIAGALGATTSEIYGVLTFYNRFHLSPRGRHTVRICRGTACHMKGAGEIIRSVRHGLGLEDGQDTTADSAFSLEEVACLGACGIAPVMMVDEETFGSISQAEALNAIGRFEEGFQMHPPPQRPDGRLACQKGTAHADKDPAESRSAAGPGESSQDETVDR